MSGLPGILADVEKVAGLATALQLAREHGGTQISLSAAEDSALVKSIGRDAAEKLVDRVGRGRVMVPMASVRGQAARRAEALAMASGEATARQIALAHDVHERTAWRLKKKAKTTPSLPLFDRED